VGRGAKGETKEVIPHDPFLRERLSNPFNKKSFPFPNKKYRKEGHEREQEGGRLLKGESGVTDGG